MKQALVTIVVFVLSCASVVNAQVVLERSVLATGGNAATTGDIYMAYTLGQVGVATVQNGQKILTQGFQQPAYIQFPEVLVSITYPECQGVIGALLTLESISACGEAAEIFWNGEAGEATFITQQDTVALVVETTGGCLINQEIPINIPNDLPPCDLEIFNTFTPNFDDQNDLWLIGEIGQERFAQNEVLIFNRWGMEVRRFINYDNVNVVWDGTDSSGNELPQGVYYYLLKIGSETYTGYINLLK